MFQLTKMNWNKQVRRSSSVESAMHFVLLNMAKFYSNYYVVIIKYLLSFLNFNCYFTGIRPINVYKNNLPRAEMVIDVWTRDEESKLLLQN